MRLPLIYFCFLCFAKGAGAQAAPGLLLAAETSSFDPYIAIPTEYPNHFNYIRKDEVQAVSDMHTKRCGLILSNGEEIIANQTCPALLQGLPLIEWTEFTNPFGSVLIQPGSIFDLRSTNNSGCRLNFRNGRYVLVNETCSDVHGRLLAEAPFVQAVPRGQTSP